MKNEASRKLSVLGALCLTVFACAPAEAPQQTTTAAPANAMMSASKEPSPRQIAVSIDASKSELRSETREGAAGSIDITDTRYYVGNTLVLVEEVVGSPETGLTTTAFYFDDDRLVFFRGRGTRTIFGQGSEPKSENFDIELGFDVDGNIVDAVKLIDGKPAELDPLDYEAPKARAEMLLKE